MIMMTSVIIILIVIIVMSIILLEYIRLGVWNFRILSVAKLNGKNWISFEENL